MFETNVNKNLLDIQSTKYTHGVHKGEGGKAWKEQNRVKCNNIIFKLK